MHYCFREYPWKGARKEIPFIEIEPKEGDDLPPIEKAFSIEINGLTDDVKWSTLRVIWLVWFDGEKRIKIKASFNLNNESFKKSMKACGAFAEKILDYISNCPKNVNDRKALEVGKMLEETDITGDLKVMVDQIRVWRDFFSAGGEELSHSMSIRHGTSITKDGYYMLIVNDSAFVITHRSMAGEHGDADSEVELARSNYYLFDFGPESKPHEVTSEYVSWQIPQKKILVVLLHESTNDIIIDHVGYRDAYDEFLKEKEEEKKDQKRREASYDRIREQEKEEEKIKKGEIKEELRGILLA